MLSQHLPGVLHQRQFRLLLAARSISLAGSAFTTVALSFAVLDLTGSVADLGLVLAVQVACMLPSLVAGGVWSDRLSRRRVMMVCNLGSFVLQASTAGLLLSHTASVWQLATLQGLRGVAFGFFAPASKGLVPEVVDLEQLQPANALIGMSMWVANVVGPAASGILTARVGPGWAIAIDAVSFLASAALLGAMGAAQLRPSPAPKSGFLRDLLGAWSEVRSRSWLWATILWGSLWLFAVVAPIYVLGPQVARQSLGGASVWGAIMAVYGTGAVLGGVIMLRLRPRRPMLVNCLVGLACIPLLISLALPAPAWMVVLLALPYGFDVGVSGALWGTALQYHVPRQMLSRVSAYDYLGSYVMLPLGYLIAGPLAQRIGLGTTLWISTVAAVICVVGALSVPGVRSMSTISSLQPAATDDQASAT